MKDGINLVNGQSLSHEEINSGLREAWNERPASNHTVVGPSIGRGDWHNSQPERHVDDWATDARLQIGSRHLSDNAHSN